MSPTSADEDFAMIRQAAHEAGRIALGFFRKSPEVWLKDGNSPVSEADLAVDRYLKSTLLGQRPGYGWLSEETDPRMQVATDMREGGRFFVVDPIDGTRSFLRGEDTWCVSIAVVEAGRPIAGVIDAPARNEVFSATAAGPARLDGDPIRVRAAAEDGRYHVAMPDALRRRLDVDQAGRLRYAESAPSLAYRLAQVASGRLDGTLIRPNANDWDIAAGDLILERAGGALVEHGGGATLYNPAGKRHGLLVAGAGHALPFMTLLAIASSSA